MDAITVRNIDLVDLRAWLDDNEELPSFKDGLVDQMVYTCQPFITTDNRYFTRILRSNNYIEQILKKTVIKSRIKARIAEIDKELAALLLKTATIVALSLDGQTSQNGLTILALNIRWFGLKIERYQRCIGFIEIDGSHLRENLVTIVNTTLIKYSIRQKL